MEFHGSFSFCNEHLARKLCMAFRGFAEHAARMECMALPEPLVQDAPAGLAVTHVPAVEPVPEHTWYPVHSSAS